MKRALILFVLIVSAAVAADDSYLAKMIACNEEEEALVSSAYDAFLTLVSQRELPKGAFSFPSRLSEETESGYRVARSYYVAPNELRGFEIFVPKDCIIEKDGVLISTVALVVDSDDTRQGQSLFTLKKKPIPESLDDAKPSS